ncbi:MAG: hypothetical protein AAB520_00385 [Patescibacteria group bacterium]
MKIKRFFLKNYIEILVTLLGSLFGFFLMFSTFAVKSGSLFIATKAWSDFANHIPLIRSFSLGNNFLPQSPLFPGEPIKYHFLFYSIVGILENLGLRIDLALNTLSFIGFFVLILMIYFLAKMIFKSKGIGLLGVIFFLFNSSLSFVYFLKNYPLSSNTINDIISNKDFQSFAPYGKGIVSAFWNLNIYTNQRHLAISFALSLFIIYQIIKPIFQKKEIPTKIYIILGIVLGLTFFLHLAVLLMTIIVILCFAISFSSVRKNCFLLLIIAACIALPQYLYLKETPGFTPSFVIGFLTANNFTFFKFTEFWIYNLGLSIILIPLGFLFANRNQKKILLTFFMIFIIGNVIQFSPEIAANHKFFNYFLLVGNMFSAYFLLKLWHKRLFFKSLAIIVFFFMIFGGIIDFFPIYNDTKIELPDYRLNQDSFWIKNNTKPNSIFLNTTYLYDPASLAGRKIFMGWPYFSWSNGYNTNKRYSDMKAMLSTNNLSYVCKLLKQNNINYVEIKIQNPPDPNIPAISNLFHSQFVRLYENPNNSYFIYDVDSTCSAKE